ncbi:MULTISPECIES: FtsK/SpoIIIE domain-containing protein [Bacillus cereus group]|uniref:FtsK/SpoIIIE domain-containing protein n=1 Tax=Bacillus cereus group TaxID=86661 RepID=UPI000F600006|nr:MULTISPECIES: FtsK/SpoIIIE domain-containing protein [Bacillus cereus group]MDA1572656.1 FtsK/SpoIIIE domain-containing protein [Bacillus cereus group sp. TH242-3LC]RRB08289.1 DNA translocase FtsK [Bacillus pacificus]
MNVMKEWFHKRAIKNLLIEVFKKSGIYYEHQTRGGKLPVFPKIHHVLETKDSVRYTFTLPNGVDPQTIEKKWFCFQQILGRELAIEGDIKRFVLHSFKHNSLQPYSYNYSDWLPHLKGHSIPVVVGKDQFGKWIVYDMTDSNSPHLLIAGETGSGKSSMVRVILSTLIQHLPPESLQLYLGDLKNSEFHFLRRVQHVKKVCMEEVEMEVMLNQLWMEIIKRRKCMEKYEVDHVNEYNKVTTEEKLPYILICIDEVAMLEDENDSMKIIRKISAVGRSLGVFLMLSMQRPDATVIDGKLKVNMTVRMGFQCDSSLNAGIIGTPGSELLEQSGQMIFKLKGLKKVQAPELKLEKAKKLVAPFRMTKEIEVSTEVKEEPLFGVLDDEE